LNRYGNDSVKLNGSKNSFIIISMNRRKVGNVSGTWTHLSCVHTRTDLFFLISGFLYEYFSWKCCNMYMTASPMSGNWTQLVVLWLNMTHAQLPFFIIINPSACVGGYIVFWKANHACPTSKISKKLQRNNDCSIIINLSYRMTTRKKANVLTKNDVTAHSNQNNTIIFWVKLVF